MTDYCYVWAWVSDNLAYILIVLALIGYALSGDNNDDV